MSIEIITFLMFGGMFGLMLLGVPLGVATGITASVFLFTNIGVNGLPLIGARIYDFVTSYVLVSLPFFVFMASIMERAGIARDLYDAMYVWSGRLRGGVASITVVVAMILAAMSGVIGGEIVLLGLIALPQMLRIGYGTDLAVGTVAAGGALGSMIPPSLNLILFGLVANVSVADLFVASATPGILLGLVYIVYILLRCKMNPHMGPIPPEEELNIPLRDKLRLLYRVIFPVGIAGAVLVSIYTGVAAVTEAAGLGAAAMLLVTMCRGCFSWELVRDAGLQTVRTSGMVLWLIFGAVSLVGVYNLLGGSLFVKQLLTGLDLAPILIILIMCGIWVLLGCVMDGTAICLLTVPIFAPIAIALNFDIIWFGILFAISCQIGYLTPPFGTAAFYLKGVAPDGIEINDIFRALLPFVGLQLLVFAALIAFPQVAIWPL